MTSRPHIAVVDYGIGNLRSAEKALQQAGADAHLTSDATSIDAADGVVVPGVGAFGRCLTALADAGLTDTVRGIATRAIDGSGVPFLGICVGMQMLFESSQENPDVPGLGVLPGSVSALPEHVKRPQMQWNRLELVDAGHWLWNGLETSPWLYFVHTYMAPAVPEVAATCEYGGDVAAALATGKLVATQFHPEKSGENGLRILSNFTDACR